ncbi:MAG: DUF3857 domain-containing protein [Bacteroidetes bacterium]|nr:DUF3857 domain-containing protein [Bacteroidota bacterium]
MRMFILKVALFTFIILGNYLTVSATNYHVDSIPAELLINSKAVIRYSDIQFEIKSPRKAIKRVEFAITILNKNGVDKALLFQFYDKFSNITSIKAIVYDSEGRKVKRIPNEDIRDLSAISGFSIYNDNRVKLINPEYLEIPFTVEYSFDIVYNGIINYPDWIPVIDYGIAVERSSFTVTHAKNQYFKYYENDFAPELNRYEVDENTIYKWLLENYKAIEKEPFSLPITDLTPVVYIAPIYFEIASHVGYSDTWENFGLFIYQLNENKLNLSDETKQKIINEISGINNKTDVAKALYSYMQNNTRYVSIQAGLGGWEPFDAETVDNLKFGDCKALSNYMIALLDIAGIKGYYTLVRAGKMEKDIVADFPSNQFNHVIVCVPIDNDTIWLECTSQNMPFGYIGQFTDNREVLLIDDSGGKLINTISYSKNDNQKICSGEVQLNNDGTATSFFLTTIKGSFYDDYQTILRDDFKGREQKLYEKLHGAGIKINSFTHEEIKDLVPFIKENLDVSFSDYGVLMGNRYLLQLNPISVLENIPGFKEDRMSDIYVRRSFTVIDSIQFKLPLEYKVYKIPENMSFSVEFGEYYSEIIATDTTILFVRKLEINEGLYSNEKYGLLVDFYEDIVKADNTKAVLIKK